MKKATLIIQALLQLIPIGLGACAGGVSLILKPDGSLMGMPPSMLYGSPFKDFLIPGIILLTVIGLGSILAAILSFRQHLLAGYAGIFFGIVLMIWIFVQVSMIGGGHWLQNLYFILGLVELCLGILIREMDERSLLR